MKTQSHFLIFGTLSFAHACAHHKPESTTDLSEDTISKYNISDVEQLADAHEGAKVKVEEGLEIKEASPVKESLEVKVASQLDPATLATSGLLSATDSTASSALSGVDSMQFSAKGKASSRSSSAGGRVNHLTKKRLPYVPRPPNQFVSSPIETESPGTVVSSTETYTDYGVNPFTLTSEDALSTFSIDVDTASYTISRRKINEGSLPPMASVRAEEFINYVDYDYDATDAEPFEVHLDGMVDPFRPQHHIVRVGVQAKDFTADTRPPLHLTFLVDVSGSMSSSDKLPMAQKAMHLLIDTLQEGDTVALATYAGRVARVLEPTSGTNKPAIHAAIDSLRSGGSTAMSSGIDIAYDMAWNSFEEGAENRVVVLSDGDANVGNTSWGTMLSQIKGYADRGVTLSTIGLGMGNYKDTTMEQLANKGDGNNYYLDSVDEARKLFVEGFNGTMISIARDVKIQVEFNEDRVRSYRLVGYENRDIADKDFRNDRVDAGEVGAGHSVTALYELALTDNAFDAFGPSDLMTVRLRYESPGADKSASERAWTYKHKELAKGNSRSGLRMAYTAGTFAEILRRSPYASGISHQELAAYARMSVRGGNAADAELLSLIEKAAVLSQTESVVLR